MAQSGARAAVGGDGIFCAAGGILAGAGADFAATVSGNVGFDGGGVLRDGAAGLGLSASGSPAGARQGGGNFCLGAALRGGVAGLGVRVSVYRPHFLVAGNDARAAEVFCVRPSGAAQSFGALHDVGRARAGLPVEQAAAAGADCVGAGGVFAASHRGDYVAHDYGVCGSVVAAGAAIVCAGRPPAAPLVCADGAVGAGRAGGAVDYALAGRYVAGSRCAIFGRGAFGVGRCGQPGALFGMGEGMDGIYGASVAGRGLAGLCAREFRAGHARFGVSQL